MPNPGLFHNDPKEGEKPGSQRAALLPATEGKDDL